MLTPNVVFGYHGCDETVAKAMLDGGQLKPSENAYDWLGHGIYFWEGSATRALRWAKEMSRQANNRIKHPAVVGAIIDLGFSLDLITPEHIESVKAAHEDYLLGCQAAGVTPLKNKGNDSKARFLDCAVMNILHKARHDAGAQPLDTVRGFFVEGEPIYPTAGLRSLDHIQVCVHNPKCIRGFFRPLNSELI